MNPPNEESTPEEPLVAIVDLDEGPRGPLLWLRVAVVLITHNWITFCGSVVTITGAIVILGAFTAGIFGAVVFLIGLAIFILGRRLILLGIHTHMRKFRSPD